MSEWKDYSLKETAADKRFSFTDGDWIEAPYITDQGIRLIQTGNIGIGRFKNTNQKFISEKSFFTLKCKEVFPDDVLVCRLADPIGRACKVPFLNQRFITSVDVTILRVDEDKFDKDFILHRINTQEFLDEANAISGGSTRQRISRKNLGELTLSLPPLPTQRKIARILSTIDGQIEKTEAILAKYQAVKQGMLQDLFTRGIDVRTGQLRPPYEDAPELYQESALGMIPKEWEVKQLKDLCLKIVDCKNRTSPFVPISKYPVIRTSNIRNGELVWDDMRYTDEISYRIWTERAIPEADDIIITREAPLGEIMKIPSGITPCLGQRTMLYKLDLTKLLPDFLVSFIMYTPVQSYLNRIAGGSTVKHLKVEEMKEILTFMPKLDEQEQIVSLLVSQQKVITQSQNVLSKLQLLKQGMMQDLLSGKVAVTA